MSENILELQHLSKTFRSNWTFRSIEAVRDVSLVIRRGESFGFLGHNGAGKTTTMKMITGLIRITSGSIQLDGEPLISPHQHRTIGYLPELPYFYEHLTVEETLDFFARLHEIPSRERSSRIKFVLETVHLESRAKSVVRSLSKGLQQRLGLAQAIINRPKLLLLDEPFSGLDPMGRVDVRNIILNLRKEGTTIFLSSHVLSDVEDICDRVSIMAQGVLKDVFELADIPKRFGSTFELIVTGEHAATGGFNALSQEVQQTAAGIRTALHFADEQGALEALNRAKTAGHEIISYSRRAPRLEEIFVKITEGRSAS